MSIALPNLWIPSPRRVVSSQGAGRAGTALLAMLLMACGGGTSGSSASTAGQSQQPAALDEAVDFFLTEAHVARLIVGADGLPDPAAPLVNPASVVSRDPLSGRLLPGFPAPLNADDDLGQLPAIDFARLRDPLTPQVTLVPRNAALVLSFSQAIAPASLDLPGAVTVVDALGVPQAHQVLLDPTNPKRLILSGVSGTSAGWRATPLVFDELGSVVQDAAGQLSVVLSSQLSDTDGQPLTLPLDRPGSSSAPLLFQPGNARLDALSRQSGEAGPGFNGFLPDLEPPRILRRVELAGIITDLSSRIIGDDTQSVLPSVTANAGLGEWAGARLLVTSALPGGDRIVTHYTVVSNHDDGRLVSYRLSGAQDLTAAVSIGDAYVVSRNEYYEPIAGPLPTDPALLAAITVDPAAHPRDPHDPQDAFNSDLRYFVEVLDEQGHPRSDVWNPATHTFRLLPPRSSLRLTFSEPMEPDSFRAYESFAVSDGELARSDAGFEAMRVGRVVLADNGRTATFEPLLEDQLDPAASSFVGFGGTAARHRLVLRTRPDPRVAEAFAAAASGPLAQQLFDLDDTGVVGITDLGGRGLGLPAAMLDPTAAQAFEASQGSAGLGAFPPAVDFIAHFETSPSDDPDYGVIVHRFMGQAEAGAMSYPASTPHDTVTQGIEYHDFPALDIDQDGRPERRFLYGPSALDVGQSVPGRLIGASAHNIEHLIDNFNAPKPGPFSNPNGEDFLISVGFGTSLPLNSAFGARFQHVYRATDASPAYKDFAGTVLDLVGLAWSPFAGQVANTALDDMQILVGLSGVNRGRGPNTNQVSGIPVDQNSGLQQQFDCNLLEWADNCQLQPLTSPRLQDAKPGQPRRTSVVQPGTPYVLDSANLFNPANATTVPGTFNQYLDFPQFNGGSDPFFGRDDVHSFPYDSIFPMLIEYRVGANQTPPSTLNFFGFSPGILSSALPRFRVWSQGQHPLAHSVPSYSQNVPPFIGNPTPSGFRAGEGGPLVDPATQTTSILAPRPNNGMPDIPAPGGYILPPQLTGGAPNQPVPNWQPGSVDADINSPTYRCITQLPIPNSNPLTNSYFANGMHGAPLPNLNAYPGPTGIPPTQWFGYGLNLAATGPPGTGCVLPTSLGGSNQTGINQIEPSTTAVPASYGDNARYYMMWKYTKRVSRVESPAMAASSSSGRVRWQRPIIDPAPASTAALGNLRVEIKVGSSVDFSAPFENSEYVDIAAPELISAVNGRDAERSFVKFRATFGIAPGGRTPPSLETVVLPYEKLRP